MAVKTLFKKNKVHAFQREVEILARLRHPNCLLFMGGCSEDPSAMMMVTEFLTGT